MLFDSHCHLQDNRLAADLAGAMQRARAAGITGMMCCGTTETDWAAVTSIGARWPEVHVSFGMHPWHVADRSPRWLDSLRDILTRHPKAGVGEIGLDHVVDAATHSVQEEVFAAQLALARELGRPATVHCRKAWERLTKVVARVGLHSSGAVLHSYSGPTELVPELESMGFLLSFSGAITRDRNRRGRAACAAVSADRLLIETDCPDLAPLGAPSPVNEPANLLLVVQAVAEIRGMSVEEVVSLTGRNAERAFGALTGIEGRTEPA